VKRTIRILSSWNMSLNTEKPIQSLGLFPSDPFATIFEQ
jgi:hypothetical protein